MPTRCLCHLSCLSEPAARSTYSYKNDQNPTATVNFVQVRALGCLVDLARFFRILNKLLSYFGITLS